MAKYSKKSKKKSSVTKRELVNKIEQIKIINVSLLVIIILLSLFISIHFMRVDHGPKIVNKINKILDDNYVFLGDSITEGYNLDKYYNNYPVVNSGVGGYNTDNILEKLNKMVYRYNPTKVFLLIGTNDIAQGHSKEHIINNIQKIIDNIKQNRKYADIYVESIYPINANKEKVRSNELIKAINEDIKKICKENNVTYINTYDLLIDEDGNLKDEYSNDGLHLTEKGYDVVTSKIKPYLQ